jgi:hypothetical protein
MADFFKNAVFDLAAVSGLDGNTKLRGRRNL